MKRINYVGKPVILLLQVVAVVFILFSSIPGYTHHRHAQTDKQTLVAVAPAVSNINREVQDQVSFLPSFVHENPWHENTWAFVAINHSSKLLTCAELHVSRSHYHSFYIVPCIHAP